MVALIFLTAHGAASLVPPIRDTVTLTALGEKNADAVLDEAVLQGYTVDGETFSSGESLEIREGKWFWSGESYMWRNESDPRQPGGTTRTIVLGIPAGKERTLDFSAYMYGGLVQITVGGRSWTIDTYSKQTITLSEPIGESRSTVLIADMLRQLAVYAAVFLALSAAAARIAKWARSKPEEARQWLGRNRGRLLYALLAAGIAALLFSHAGEICFWTDELIQVQGTCRGITDAVEYCLQLKDATPPLFAVLATLWYRVAPYGEQWLLLICILPAGLSIYVTGIAGEKLAGQFGGFIAAAAVAFSSTVWNNVAYEYRAYAFSLLFSALSLYAHIRKNWEGTPRWKVFYSLCLICLAMSHYFGMLACAALFAADLVLVIKKKISWKMIFQYFPAGLVSAVWIAAVYLVTIRYREAANLPSWYAVPTLEGIKNIVLYLCGRRYAVYLAAVSGGAYLLFSAAYGKRQFQWERFYSRYLMWASVGVLALMYVYGNYVNLTNTMFEGRYFTWLIPYLSLLIPTVLVRLLDAVSNGDRALKNTIAFVLAAMLFCDCAGDLPKRASPLYREAADWIYTQSNYIFDQDTMVVT